MAAFFCGIYFSLVLFVLLNDQKAS